MLLIFGAEPAPLIGINESPAPILNRFGFEGLKLLEPLPPPGILTGFEPFSIPVSELVNGEPGMFTGAVELCRLLDKIPADIELSRS